MYKNKGFTLVELIAVLAILGILVTIGTVEVNKTLTNNKQNGYKLKIASFADETKTWAIDHPDKLPSDGQMGFITLGTLVNGGYITDYTNPLTNKKFALTDYICIKSIKDSENYDYYYNGNKGC